MIDWLDSFLMNTARQPGTSCSCSKDCDRERDAAYDEIDRLRGLVGEPREHPLEVAAARFWHWIGYGRRPAR